MSSQPAPAATKRRPPATSRRSAPLSALFLATLLITVARGAIELIVGKSIAYGVQVAVIALFLGVLLAAGARSTKRLTSNLIAAYLFVLAALVSMVISSVVSGIDYAWLYVVVMCFYLVILVAFNSFVFAAVARIAVGGVIKAVALIMIAVAVSQQYLGFRAFPGSDSGTFGTTLRPASLTGSFLHYPIALSLLAFALLGIYAQTRRSSYLIVGLLSFGGVAFSLSRSGLVLCVVGLAVGFVLMRDLNGKLKLIAVAVLGVLLLALAGPSDLLLTRMLSIFQVDGAGNAVRLGQWNHLLEEWVASPLVVGSQTGVYTNVTGNFSSVESSVAESSVLQQLINFGLIGLVAFYAVMIGSVRACPPEIPWFRAGLIGALSQSFVYQSVEVLPFMVLFALMPLFATRYGREGTAAPELPPLGLRYRS